MISLNPATDALKPVLNIVTEVPLVPVSGLNEDIWNDFGLIADYLQEN